MLEELHASQAELFQEITNAPRGSATEEELLARLRDLNAEINEEVAGEALSAAAAKRAAEATSEDGTPPESAKPESDERMEGKPEDFPVEESVESLGIMGPPEEEAPHVEDVPGHPVNAMELVHNALDVAGFIPGVGAAPDLVNAAIYALEGDAENAAWSATAAVPIAGDAAKATKLGKQGLESGLKTGRPASSLMSARLLKRQLASEAQMAGPGLRIAGAGTSKGLRQAERLAREYGGEVDDWVKMSSDRWSDGDGLYDLFETHWYENIRTGKRYEFKTKYPRAENYFGPP